MLKLQELSNGHALLAFGWALFERHGLRAKLDLRTDAVLEYLASVESGYRDVAYHNAVHGADVAHALHWLLCSDSLLPMTRDDPLLLFTAIIATLAHDLGHDGFNNAFHTHSNSPIAIASCYQAPLERFHLSQAFARLAKKDSMLCKMPLAERKQVQTWMREIVLATDFGVHMDVINEFKAMLEMRGCTPKPQTADEEAAAAAALLAKSASAPAVVVGSNKAADDDTFVASDFEAGEKILTIKMAIKTADLGYLTKGRAYCHVWTERVLEEFFTQGDTEKSLGLPVSFGCDRDAVNIPQSQLGFYQFMIDPLYKAMNLLVPMDQQMRNLDMMRGVWQAKKDADEGKGQKKDEDDSGNDD